MRRGITFFMKNMKRLIQSIKANLLDTVILIAVSVLYLLNNKYIKAATVGIAHEFFVCFFNDLMAPMFMLAYSNILLGTVNRRIERPVQIFLFCLIVGFVWEFVAPLMKAGAVWDPLDILCYLIGGGIYGVLQKGKAIIRDDKC